MDSYKSSIELASVENKKVSGLRAISKRRASTSSLSQLRLSRVVEASPLLFVTAFRRARGKGPDLMDRVTQGIVMRVGRNRIGGFGAQKRLEPAAAAAERPPIN
jgi:hypothetical protein